MILNPRILSDTSTFNGVGYNEKKVMKDGTGELLAARNFELMDKEINKENIKQFFKDWGKNSRVKNQQFHAMISCKGEMFKPKELEEAAHKFVEKMGYSKNPYIVYFHNDTDNNHVHIVSTRVGLDKKKIDSDFENKKSISIMEKIGNELAKKYAMSFDDTTKEAQGYKYKTVAQFNMLMEKHGFTPIKKEGVFQYAKNGSVEGEIRIDDVEKSISINKASKTDNARTNQLKALFHKYASIHSAKPIIADNLLAGKRENPSPSNKHTSDFAKFMSDVFKLDIIYHAAKGKEPYGYSIIDNSGLEVFKGAEIMNLKQLINGGIDPIEAVENEKSDKIIGTDADSKIQHDPSEIPVLEEEHKKNGSDNADGKLDETAQNIQYQNDSDWLSRILANYNAGAQFIGQGSAGEDGNKSKQKKKKKI